ncbi:MAG TPA: transketolase [Tepidisphaeraceae bacterium]|jgi:transketolase
MSYAAAVNRKAIDIGKLAVEMTTSAGSGHPSTALSLAHLVAVLMYDVMRWDPKDPWNVANDRLVLSEGHAVPIIYAALADIGAAMGKSKSEAKAITRDEVLKLRSIESPIDGHPNPGLGVHFFDAATGSLGQGLSVAAGVAAAAKMDKLDKNVYCLIGDGEAREGQIWEAMDFIADHLLTNCVPIFNCNELAQSDWVSAQQSAEVIAKKCDAYGFVARMVDGHDAGAIKKALNEIHVVKNGARPLAIIARTIKGWGAPIEQGTGKHGHPVAKDKLPTVLGQLDATAKELNVADYKVDGELKLPPPASRTPEPGTRNPIKLKSFPDALAAVGLEKELSAGKAIATRQAYGAALLALAEADRRVIGLDADVKNSTFAEWLFKKHPEQFLECRIAEQNMVSVAAGCAAAGKIPFCSTFAKFFERGYDQIEMAINTCANFKMVGSHAGVTLAADGPSQMSLPDVAFFRAFTKVKNYVGETALYYFFPADAIACYRITELMANLKGPCYQRTLRAGTKMLYKESDTFEVGGFKVVREGTDLVFVSAGYMVHECIRAADELAKNGRKAAVVDAYTFPLKTDGILDLAARSGGRIVTVEDNYTGGLDAEIATAITSRGDDIQLRSVFVTNMPKSGKEPSEVLDYSGVGFKAILNAVS